MYYTAITPTFALLLTSHLISFYSQTFSTLQILVGYFRISCHLHVLFALLVAAWRRLPYRHAGVTVWHRRHLPPYMTFLAFLRAAAAWNAWRARTAKTRCAQRVALLRFFASTFLYLPRGRPSATTFLHGCALKHQAYVHLCGVCHDLLLTCVHACALCIYHATTTHFALRPALQHRISCHTYMCAHCAQRDCRAALPYQRDIPTVPVHFVTDVAVI